MCGIAGIVNLNQSEYIPEKLVQSMCDVIEHRGPDDQGIISDKNFVLGSRRLAILDLSPNGHMPMQSRDGRFSLVYNGEIYNYREIRKDLPEIDFQSNTDTEVLLHSYIKWGPDFLHKCNGMFGFAIYDKQEQSLFIARDRLGIKPIFYTIYQNRLYFGSELKSLFVAGVPKIIEDDAVEELMCFRYVAGERTIFKNIKRLLPGHFLKLKDGKIEIKAWWQLKDFASQQNNINDATAWYKETFDSSINYRTISDVPVGILLSGGLDSGSVAASLGQNPEHQISAFTIRFHGDGYDEGNLAKITADKFNIKFHEWYVSPENLWERWNEALDFTDEPLFHASDLFVLEISKFAKSYVTVLLSGEGGDETLGGYVRYQPLKYPKLLKAGLFAGNLTNKLPLKGRLKKLTDWFGFDSVSDMVLYNAAEITPKKLQQLGFNAQKDFNYRKRLLADAEEVYGKDYFRQVMFYDQHTYLNSLLDRNDRMTMGASIECRVPFLDYRIIEGLAKLPTSEILKKGKPKGLLVSALGDRLPQEILQHKKWGFGVPWNKYFREQHQFRNIIQKLPQQYWVQNYFKDRKNMEVLVSEYLAGNNSHYPVIHQLVNLSIWFNKNFV